MAFTNIFSLDKDGNPIIIEAETGEQAVHFDPAITQMTAEQRAQYWQRVEESMIDRRITEMYEE